MPSGRVSIRKSVSSGVTTDHTTSGNIGQGIPISSKEIFSNTTAGWNSQPQLVSLKDALYVYTDYSNDGGVDIPAFKVGDGTTYVVDLPFSYTGSVTQEQIEFWNNKVTAFIDPSNPSRLVLSKD